MTEWSGDIMPCEKQLRCYQYLFDIIHCKHMRITSRLKALQWPFAALKSGSFKLLI